MSADIGGTCEPRRMMLVGTVDGVTVAPWTTDSPTPVGFRVYWFVIDRFGNVVSFSSADCCGSHGAVTRGDPGDVIDFCSFHEGAPCAWEAFAPSYGRALARVLARDVEAFWVELADHLSDLTSDTARLMEMRR